MGYMLEHPDITWALRTGYPSWNQPVEDDYDDYMDEDEKECDI